MDTFYHRTNNLAALASGRIKALKHLARDNPDLELEVESGAGGRNLGGLVSAREKLRAQDAYTKMQGVKDVDNVFLTKDTLSSDSYGKYIVEKKMRSPTLNPKMNLIANEYITPRALSLKSNATVYAPDEELEGLREKHKDILFRGHSEMNARKANLVDTARTLGQKLMKSASIDTLYSGSEKEIHRLLSPNATIVGSEGIGINIAGASDRDILVPYKTREGYNRLVSKLNDQGFGLKESPYNARKRDGYKVYSYKDDTRDVDVALVHGGKSSDLAAHVRKLRDELSDDRKQEIISKKTKLKNAWILPEYRYKKYKRGVDKELGLTQFHE